MLNSFPAPLLEKDCAVCKDQFSLQTEDPDEQVVITLPCKHPFHSPCIVPWLKQNGTCPSCRHQLVPQPGSTPNPNENSGPGPGPSTSTSNPPQPQPTSRANFFTQQRTDTSPRWPAASRDRNTRESPERNDGNGGGFLGMVGNLLHTLAGGHPSPAPVPSNSGSGPDSLPGSWEPNSSPRPESGNRPSHTRGQSIWSNDDTHPNSRPTRSQSSLHDRSGSTFGSNHNTSSNNRGRDGNSTNEWASLDPGRNRRSSRERERERNRDRYGQRRNTNPWDRSELD